MSSSIIKKEENNTTELNRMDNESEGSPHLGDEEELSSFECVGCEGMFETLDEHDMCTICAESAIEQGEYRRELVERRL